MLPARPGLSPRLVSARGRVAVRLSSHPVAAGLARTLGRAVTATSANPAGGPPPADVADLDPALAERLDLILDAAPAPEGRPSTILDLCGDQPVLLRPGVLAGKLPFGRNKR